MQASSEEHEGHANAMTWPGAHLLALQIGIPDLEAEFMLKRLGVHVPLPCCCALAAL